MACIRSRKEERTGVQEVHPFCPSIDLGCDFVMVYGIGNHLEDRISQYRKASYEVHLMTGIAWGAYQDYLDGEWDGKTHWDEAQCDRQGNAVLHGPSVPYMVPTPSLADYLTEKLKTAVDCQVTAIYLEEPEFWDCSGYSPAFRRAYENRFGLPFEPQHTSMDAHRRCALLKMELYRDCAERIGRQLKAYARERYGTDLRFYIPTHSLLNYAQWKILSPEGLFLEHDVVDGFIGQVWTGTSRVVNIYQGVFGERVFETAYLEYGMLKSLAGSRRLWFLADPIEDCPGYDWENYRACYIRTLVASLLHPQVSRYEVCPWPHRVMEGRYPRDASEPLPIPDSYRTFLSSMFQLLGEMDQPCPQEPSVGIFLSTTCLMERSYPDTVPFDRPWSEALWELLLERANGADPEVVSRFRAFLDRTDWNDGVRHAFSASIAFPDFFGLAMPLVKHGLPLQPVVLEGIQRPGALEGVRAAILSHSFMKPLNAETHHALAQWVKQGGVLILVREEKDFPHPEQGWWSPDFRHPEDHLLACLGLDRLPHDPVSVGQGTLVCLSLSPARLCLSADDAQAWCRSVAGVLAASGAPWTEKNHFTLRRGPYLISHVMTESISRDPQVFDGHFVDLMEDGFPVIRQKTVRPGESCLLLDLDRVAPDTDILATAARILAFSRTDSNCLIRAAAAKDVLVHIRLRLPCPAMTIQCEGLSDLPLRTAWDAESRSLLVTYRSPGKEVLLTLDL